MRTIIIGFAIAATCVIGGIGFCQTAPSMPLWLVAYPGATPNSKTFGALVQSTYTTPAKLPEVLEHYHKLFEGAFLRWQPNPDGIGVSIRGDSSECDLLILVREQTSGTFVDVSCAAKSHATTAAQAKSVEIVTMRPSPAAGGSLGVRPIARPPIRPMPSTAEMEANHARRVAELGIHPTYHDAPAPPLVWPSWLAHIKGVPVAITKGVDQSRKAYLKARYVTTQPMTAIHDFYEELLNSHEYPVHTAKLSTGQTISGIMQNAWGFVEGTNYPDGAPGARTVIHVGFTRSKLNEPITVEMRITAYEFVAPKNHRFSGSAR